MIDDPGALRGLSQHNMVRLLLPETHQEAADLLSRWLDERVLQVDDSPRFYLYTMRYRTTNGGTELAKGVIGALGLEPIGEHILGHEETMPRTGADRRRLLAATQANLDLIIALSSAPELPGLITPRGRPRFSVEADGVLHELYDFDGAPSDITRAVDRHPLAIADGHHRFTAALEYQASRAGSGGWDSIMTFVAPAEGSGLEVRPIHRLFARFELGDIDDVFDRQPSPPLPPSEPGSLTLVTTGDSWLLTPKREPLEGLPGPFRVASTAVARELLYPRCGVIEEDAAFHSDVDRLLGLLERGGAALLMAGVPDEAISAAADQHLRFPRKTTLFVPKPRAGFVLRQF